MNILAIIAVIAPVLLAIDSEEESIAIVEGAVSGLEPKGCPNRSCNKPPVNDCHCPKGYIAYLVYTLPAVGAAPVQNWNCVKLEESCKLQPFCSTFNATYKPWCFGNVVEALPQCHFPDFFFADAVEITPGGPLPLHVTYKDATFTKLSGVFFTNADLPPCGSGCPGGSGFCGVKVPFPDSTA